MRKRPCLLVALFVLGAWPLAAVRGEPGPAATAIVAWPQAPYAERLAAREVRRYAYLRSGRLLPIGDPAAAEENSILVGSKDRVLAAAQDVRPWKAMLDHGKLRTALAALKPEEYLLTGVAGPDGAGLLVAGGDPVGTLYAAYRLAERWGVRFYLHGDVVPDGRVALEILNFEEHGRPLFDRRGIQPFHDFPEGPDWWNAEAYKAVVGQLPKLRMNFFGLHTYPEGGVGPEPVVWIGPPGEIEPGPAARGPHPLPLSRTEKGGRGGRVRASYPSRHFTTLNGTWGDRPMQTGQYTFGAAQLFTRDDYGADYMSGMSPLPKTPEDCNRLFARMGGVLRQAFTLARRLGVKTCLGTETPLVIPTPVKQRLKAAGKDPASPAVVEEVYEGIFRRIAATHPLDYYWFWTPEGWTWEPVKPEQIQATLADFRSAIAAARKVKAPFTLATCGWVLGPPQQPALFDQFLPRDMPMSCINRLVGHEFVEKGFANVHGRPIWAIPWLEDDPALTAAQLWAGRMRRDAADARAYGCTGLLGIHWRTRILGPNVSALARAAWENSGLKGPGSGCEQPNPEPRTRNRYADAPASSVTPARTNRYLRADDFYADWAQAEFGPEAAGPLGRLFARIDGRLPRPADWVNGPGGIKPDPRPWSEVQKEYAFVDQMQAHGPQVCGAGSRERFEYWLESFRYLRAMARVNCTWARYNQAVEAAKREKDPAAGRRVARDRALPLRKELVAEVAEVQRHLLATISTYGELGTVTNWQQHLLPDLLSVPGEELSHLLGGPLSADALPPRELCLPPRIVVPVVRSGLSAGEPLELTVILLGLKPKEAAVFWRPLGAGRFERVPLRHVARGVYAATLPAQSTRFDLEYYVQAVPESGAALVFPATAPQTCQTVVVCDR
jgi:hypothetical protein